MMSLASKIKKIEGVIHDFEALQDDHFEALQSDKLNDVLSWTEKRFRVFSQLKQCMEQAEQDVEIKQDLKFVGRLREHVALLLDKEKCLETSLGRCKMHLEDQMGVVRKGKKALKGYSVNAGYTPRPRVLSNRT